MLRRAFSPSVGAIVYSGPVPYMHYVTQRRGSNSVSFRAARREIKTRPKEGKQDLAVLLKQQA